jgi:methionyl-tRNA synthetase
MKVLVASAWPYVNNIPHLGNLIGSILSADVFARYARMKYGKENVLLVSGSDEHGTPIEIEAKKKRVDPRILTNKYHEYFLTLLKKWDISFDNYSRTESSIHKEFVVNFFKKLEEKGFIYSQDVVLPFCKNDNMFLPDRFVSGTCPYCSFPDARGDQCDNCGKLLDPNLLINPKCSLCGADPEFRLTKHWILDLPKVQDKVREWLEKNNSLSEKVIKSSISWISEGLKPRSVTRDNKWGIPSPFKGSEGKTIYVWFEALLGYISATMEYFNSNDNWKEFWREDSLTYFFIGKDNIPFHAVILPAMLIMYNNNLRLPYKIPATDYLLYEGDKFSKSRGIGIWADEALEILEVDYWRFSLIRMRPEEKDSNFTFRELIRIVNSEMNDDIGNYVNRVLSLINRIFNGIVPPFSKSQKEDEDFMSKIKETARRMSSLLDEGKLKAGLEVLIELAREGNSYLNTRAPWNLYKTNIEEAKTVLNLAFNSVRVISICIYPFTPKSSSKLWNLLNESKSIEEVNWFEASELNLKGGNKISEKIEPLFNKLPQNFDEVAKRKLIEIREKLSKFRPF